MSLPEIIRASMRRKTASIAQAMLDGTVGIVEGSRQLVRIRISADVDAFDPDFLLFLGIDSETGHLPVGDERRHWAPAVLTRKDVEIAAAEEHYRENALSACSRLVARFSAEKAPPDAYGYFTPDT
jgi:hypothetical protein